MNYLERTLHQRIKNLFKPVQPEGLILTGIVGCGKTTLINKVVEELSDKYHTFSYTGDDLHFREAVTKDTKYLLSEIQAQTQKKALVFIDEVQKCESVFDAIKYAFDRGVSFIVSGSNPHFLKTAARQRLQRRGAFLNLAPFSLPEILAYKDLIPQNLENIFLKIIAEKQVKIPSTMDLTFNDEIKRTVEEYLQYGGLPLSYQTKNTAEKIEQIARVVERGFEAVMHDTSDARDIISIELAHLHSKELTYKTLFKQTGITKRDTVNDIVNALVGHGYLLKKKPLLFEKDRRTYLNTFSYIDPGLVSYLTGEVDLETARGQRVEGLVHAQLTQLVQEIPFKVQLNYFKPYTIDANGKTKFQPGEIDFVITQGKSHIPIEVKSSMRITDSETAMVRTFVKEHKCPFGVVLYAGVPQWRKEHKLLYWPYWLI